MSLNQEKVIGGTYNGRSPTKPNLMFIRSLEAAVLQRAREIAELEAKRNKQEKQDELDRQLSFLVFSDADTVTLPAVQQLIANGAQPQQALSSAIESDRTDIAEFLIDKGADVNSGIDHESGPYIFHASSVKMVKLLLAKGANVNLSSPLGWGGNWLTAAVRANGRGRSLAVIEFLLASGVSVNAKDVGGDTPLALARSQRESVVKEIAEEMAKAKSEYLQELEKDLKYRDAVIGLLLKYGAKG